MSVNAPRPPLGQVMVEHGLLSEDELEVVLAEQDRNAKPLGELVVELGFASSGAVANALAEQHGAPLRSEFGFGSGLRKASDQVRLAPQRARDPQPLRVRAPAEAPDEERGRLAAEAEALRQALAASEGERERIRSELEHLRAQPESTPVPAPAVAEHEPTETTHLLFIPTPAGYRLLERAGAAPRPGDEVEIGDTTGATRYVVRKRAEAPLPDARQICAYLEELPEPSTGGGGFSGSPYGED